jgi:hypothetical protein
VTDRYWSDRQISWQVLELVDSSGVLLEETFRRC